MSSKAKTLGTVIMLGKGMDKQRSLSLKLSRVRDTATDSTAIYGNCGHDINIICYRYSQSIFDGDHRALVKSIGKIALTYLSAISKQIIDIHLIIDRYLAIRQYQSCDFICMLVVRATIVDRHIVFNALLAAYDGDTHDGVLINMLQIKDTVRLIFIKLAFITIDIVQHSLIYSSPVHIQLLSLVKDNLVLSLIFASSQVLKIALKLCNLVS